MQHWNGIHLHGTGLTGEYLMIRKRVKAGCRLLSLAAGLSRLGHGIHLMSGPFLRRRARAPSHKLHMLTTSGGKSIGGVLISIVVRVCYIREWKWCDIEEARNRRIPPIRE